MKGAVVSPQGRTGDNGREAGPPFSACAESVGDRGATPPRPEWFVRADQESRQKSRARLDGIAVLYSLVWAQWKDDLTAERMVALTNLLASAGKEMRAEDRRAALRERRFQRWQRPSTRRTAWVQGATAPAGQARSGPCERNSLPARGHVRAQGEEELPTVHVLPSKQPSPSERAPRSGGEVRLAPAILHRAASASAPRSRRTSRDPVRGTRNRTRELPGRTRRATAWSHAQVARAGPAPPGRRRAEPWGAARPADAARILSEIRHARGWPLHAAHCQARAA